ncbi:MAG: MFS transporter [Bacteroidales bacterium]|nr:MFS transporter [Bacteroidales bacterium]
MRRRNSDKNASDKSSAIKNIFRSLHYRNYRLFFGGQSLSLIGTWIQRITIPWLVYRMTGSPLLLGVVGFAGQIPTFILSPFAGVLTDRWNRYRILISTQVLSMIQALILAILYMTGHVEIWNILLLSIILGCINALDTPARQSFMFDLVDDKKDLGNAIALNSIIVNGARLLGPSIAGILIASFGEGVCFTINGLSYIFVIWSLIMIKVKPQPRSENIPNVFREMKEGFNYTFSFKPIKAIILLLALISFMGMPYSVLMPVFAKDIFHGNSNIYGFLMGASGIGAFAGAFYLASKKTVLGLEKLIPLAAGIFGIGLAAFSLSRLFTLSMILMVATGMGFMMQMACSNTILQTITDDDKRGRVMSFYTMAFMGTAPFGNLLAGTLASWIGAPNTLLICGLFCVFGALVFIKKLPDIIRSISPIYAKMGIIHSFLLCLLLI